MANPIFDTTTPGITLSNGDLTATNISVGYSSAECTTDLLTLTDKIYVEIYVNAAPSSMYFGLTGLTIPSGDYCGKTSSSWAYGSSGYSAHAAGTVPYGDSYAALDVIGLLAYEGDLYFSKNGVWQGAADAGSPTGTVPAYSGVLDDLWVAASLFQSGAEVTARLISADIPDSSHVPPDVQLGVRAPEVFTSALIQPYGETFVSTLRQYYGDKDVLTSVNRQLYRNKSRLTSAIRQSYRDKYAVLSALRQGYALNATLLSALVQPFSSPTLVGTSALRQSYDINERDTLLSALRQSYSLASEVSPIESRAPSSIVVGGTTLTLSEGVSAVSINYDIDTYCGVFNMTLLDPTFWGSLEDTAEVVITVRGVDHHSVVTSKSSQESFGGTEYTIESRSPAVLLDYPYADMISEDFEVSGAASTVVNDIAALEGFSVIWELDSDPIQTSTTYEVGGDYPISAIRDLVRELGGRVNSHPDGSIHIVKRQPVDSDKYETTPVESILTTLEDIISISTDSDQRSGENSFSVSAEAIDEDYSLESEQVTNSNYLIKAYKTPWVSSRVELVTSELTNVTIDQPIPTSPITEVITQEDVEITDGAGIVNLPCYGNISYDYGTRADLGVIEIDEFGNVTTDTIGETLVNITYDTKYWQWDVTDPDSETVQFILFTLV